MAFGWKQRKNPTPTHIVRWLNFSAKTCMGLVVAINSAPFITAAQASTISWYLAALAPILMQAKSLWGVETEETMIPKNQVEVMEEKQEP